MKHIAYLFLVASSIAWSPVLAKAAARPHYGGTLRVETSARVLSLDPSEWPGVPEADAILRIRELIFDRLVRLDQNGEAQPALALAWQRDAQTRTWQFKLRPSVKWQDGAPLTAADIVSSLAGASPDAIVRLEEPDTLEIKLNESQPDLLTTLATDAAWMIRRPATASSGALPVGTGPFRLTVWEPGHRAVLEANNDYWGGRPFVDRIEIQMGRSSRDQLIDLELDKVDVVGLDPAEARRAQQEEKKIWSSAPVQLLSLRFDLNKPAVHDRRLREAIANAIDRAAIQKVLLQNYGEATGSIFPKWVSGYAFLFPPEMDLVHARQLITEIDTPPTLKLGYDANDALARQTAERLAVNARDAGITMQISPLPTGWKRMPDTGADLRVERTRIDGPTLDEACRQVSATLGLSINGDRQNPEQVYAIERQFLDSLTVVPLVYASDLVGLGPRVKDWRAMPWGEWRLEDVWLEAKKP